MPSKQSRGHCLSWRLEIQKQGSPDCLVCFGQGLGKQILAGEDCLKPYFPIFCPMKTVSDSEEPSMYTQSYRHRNLCHYHQSLLTLCTGEAHGRKYHTGNIPKRGITASSLHTSSFQTKCRGSRAISVVVKAGEASLGGKGLLLEVWCTQDSLEV